MNYLPANRLFPVNWSLSIENKKAKHRFCLYPPLFQERAIVMQERATVMQRTRNRHAIVMQPCANMSCAAVLRVVLGSLSELVLLSRGHSTLCRARANPRLAERLHLGRWAYVCSACGMRLCVCVCVFEGQVPL